MQYAVIETGGKQYKVTHGLILEIEKLAENSGSILFDKVLLHSADGGELDIGTPYISDIYVSGKVLGEVKGDKVRVLRFLAKSRHRRVYGHRPIFTKVQIESIEKKVKAGDKNGEKQTIAPKKTAARKPAK